MTTEYYPFQSSDDERQRLIGQGELVDPPEHRRLSEKPQYKQECRRSDVALDCSVLCIWRPDFPEPEGKVSSGSKRVHPAE